MRIFSKEGAAATLMVASMASGTIVSPANCQTIADTLRQLGATAKRLGGVRGTTGATGSKVATGGADATSGERTSMVPERVLLDDPSDTSLETTPTVARRVATFDIRGLKLGMSPREVSRIVGRQGFRHSWNQVLLTQGSFEVEAARLANQSLDRPVEAGSPAQLSQVEGTDAAGDDLNLKFAPYPGGPRLTAISYHAKLDGTAPAAALQALVAKYGPPAGRFDLLMTRWSNAKGPLDMSSATLVAIIDGGAASLTLDESFDEYQSARKRLSERAAQLAAGRGSGVRF